MIDAEHLPEAIQWHEGMLLAPQHFQQSSLRGEELLHYHVMAASPFHWGVKKLRIDPVLLIDGIFRVLELEAVLPDGLVAFHRHEDEAGGAVSGESLELDLSPFDDDMKAGPVTVHLAVPVLKSSATMVRGALSRYESREGRPVVDENTGESEMAIPRLKPRLSLIATENPPQKFSTIPIAKILYKNETITRTDFIPPLLSVTNNSPVWEICSAVAQRLREKAVYLSDKLGTPGGGMKGAMVLETRFLIQGMVSGLPQFEALLSTGASHPFVVYLALCRLVGDIAALGLGAVPPALAAYNHNDLRTTFQHARRFIDRMVDEGVLETHTAIPFDYQDGVFSLLLRQEWTSRTLIIGIKARPGAAEKDVLHWMEETLIGSDSLIESLKEKRILGAEREKSEGEGELLPTRGVILFAVSADPEFVFEEEKLILLNTSDPKGLRAPSEVRLYVRNRPPEPPKDTETE